MNQAHLDLCSSDEWAEMVEQHIVPFVIDGVALGADVLEVGPGPGRTTEVLCRRIEHLTAIEIDDDLAAALAARMAGTNVEVVHADATAMPFEADRFTAATSFTMLHHVPSPALQDQLFAEVARVVRPGGVFVGTDSLDEPEWRKLHVGDTCVPVDPGTVGERLRAAGFTDVEVEVNPFAFRFKAVVPVD